MGAKPGHGRVTRTLTRTRDLRPKPPQATTNPHTFLVADIWEVNGESWKPSARWISTHSAPAEKPTARKPRSCSPRSGHRPSPGKHLTTQGLGRGVDRESTTCNHRGRKTEPNPQHQQARLPTAARSQPAQATSPSGALTTAPPHRPGSRSPRTRASLANSLLSGLRCKMILVPVLTPEASAISNTPDLRCGKEKASCAQ